MPAFEGVAKDRVVDWDGELEFERTVLWLVIVLPEEYSELDVLELWPLGTLDRAEEPLLGTMDEVVKAESRPLGFAWKYPGHVDTINH